MSLGDAIRDAALSAQREAGSRADAAASARVRRAAALQVIANRAPGIVRDFDDAGLASVPILMNRYERKRLGRVVVPERVWALGDAFNEIDRYGPPLVIGDDGVMYHWLGTLTRLDGSNWPFGWGSTLRRGRRSFQSRLAAGTYYQVGGPPRAINAVDEQESVMFDSDEAPVICVRRSEGKQTMWAFDDWLKEAARQLAITAATGSAPLARGGLAR